MKTVIISGFWNCLNFQNNFLLYQTAVRRFYSRTLRGAATGPLRHRGKFGFAPLNLYNECLFCSTLVLAFHHLALTFTAQFLAFSQQHPQKGKDKHRHAHSDTFLCCTHLVITRDEYHIHYCCVYSKNSYSNVRIPQKSHIIVFYALLRCKVTSNFRNF